MKNPDVEKSRVIIPLRLYFFFRARWCVHPAGDLLVAALPAHPVGGVGQPQHAPLLNPLHPSLHRPRSDIVQNSAPFFHFFSYSICNYYKLL
jgi:hypothetical protein